MSPLNTIKKTIVQRLVKKNIALASDLSDEGFIRATYLIEALPLASDQKDHIKKTRELIREKHPGIQLIRRVLTHLSPNCRDHLAANLFVNGVILGQQKRARFEKENGIKPLFLLVISPTMRCNLSCYGCYAGNYTQKR